MGSSGSSTMRARWMVVKASIATGDCSCKREDADGVERKEVARCGEELITKSMPFIRRKAWCEDNGVVDPKLSDTVALAILRTTYHEARLSHSLLSRRGLLLRAVQRKSKEHKVAESASVNAEVWTLPFCGYLGACRCCGISRQL